MKPGPNLQTHPSKQIPPGAGVCGEGVDRGPFPAIKAPRGPAEAPEVTSALCVSRRSSGGVAPRCCWELETLERFVGMGEKWKKDEKGQSRQDWVPQTQPASEPQSERGRKSIGPHGRGTRRATASESCMSNILRLSPHRKWA